MRLRSALVFPGGSPSGLTWARRAVDAGMRVVGASSLAEDPARSQYSEWDYLPWIDDADFASSLGRCVTGRQIDMVYTSHAVVWSVLRELLTKVAPAVCLKPERPWAAELADYREYRARAARFEPLEIAGTGLVRRPLGPVQLAALVRQFELTPGQCDYQKLEALTAVYRRVPDGDIVEIGSLWGRSAVALAFLARHYGIGKLLCVDPWASEELRQGIPRVDEAAKELPMAEVFDAFRINLAPFADMANYVRAGSADAARTYRHGRRVTTEDFGETVYTGEIALLHIDGNHALQAVRDDIAAWQPCVGRGGWIVFDDYCWPFGNGPKVAADEFCQECSRPLTAAFVAGGALFVEVG